jgi:hypothetical protein
MITQVWKGKNSLWESLTASLIFSSVLARLLLWWVSRKHKHAAKDPVKDQGEGKQEPT